MSVDGSVLHYDSFGDVNPERGKIPDGSDAGSHHTVDHLLRRSDRDSQYTDADIRLLH